MNILREAVALCLFYSFFQEINSLDNGLAITPPSKCIDKKVTGVSDNKPERLISRRISVNRRFRRKRDKKAGQLQKEGRWILTKQLLQLS